MGKRIIRVFIKMSLTIIFMLIASSVLALINANGGMSGFTMMAINGIVIAAIYAVWKFKPNKNNEQEEDSIKLDKSK